MSTLDLKVHSFSKKVSSVKHNKKIVRRVMRGDIVMII